MRQGAITERAALPGRAVLGPYRGFAKSEMRPERHIATGCFARDEQNQPVATKKTASMKSADGKVV